LYLFDTAVVDLTQDCTDPVETLMQVQLGGGTDIGQALTYAEGIINNPRRTIIVLITDFYEGAPLLNLLAATRRLVESGVTLLGLSALDYDANPNYNRDIAQQLVNLGAHAGAMTPGELNLWNADDADESQINADEIRENQRPISVICVLSIGLRQSFAGRLRIIEKELLNCDPSRRVTYVPQ
jgi:hypothetical protein